MKKQTYSRNHSLKDSAFRRPSKKALVTNMCLAGIIVLVYLTAFGPVANLLSGAGPVLKGSTGEDVVGLQIVVDDESDVAAYLDMLERYGAKGTFFFGDQQTAAMESELLTVVRRATTWDIT